MPRFGSFPAGRLVFALVLVISLGTSAILYHSARRTTRNDITQMPRWGQLPLAFEANVGQTDRAIDYISHGPGYVTFLNSSGATLSLHRSNAKSVDAVHMTLMGGTNSSPAAEEEISGKVNYFIGNNPAEWKTGIPAYKRIEYRGVYPGIDLAYYGNAGQLEYDFAVQPGTDVRSIVLRMDGPRAIHLNQNGDLVLELANGEIAWQRPIAYQMQNHKRQVVASQYHLDGNTVRFQVGTYDHSQPLIVDPSLSFGTYVGAADSSSTSGIAVDSSNNVYIVGSANSAQYPTTAGAYQTTYGGGSQDAFITKLSSDGSKLIYSTYVGGSDADSASTVAVDSSDNAYVGGETISTNFPVTSGAMHLSNGTSGTGFMLKLNSTGGALIYSAEIGSANVTSIAIDSAGNAYATGGAYGVFQTTPGAYKTTANTTNCQNVTGESFVLELNASGSAPVYSTYVADCEQGEGIAVQNGEAYITGATYNQHPVTPGAPQSTFGGYIDAFVTKLNTNGSALVYSTYLGGTLGDQGNGIAVDGSGNAVVAGFTGSSNFPVSHAFQATMTGNSYPQDAFVTKLNASGTALLYSTYLGGATFSFANGIALDSSGNAYVTGFTGSADFPTKDAFQGICGASNFTSCMGTAFVSEFNPNGSFLASTYYGPPTQTSEPNAIAIDSQGNAYIAGQAGSGLPTTPSAYEKTTSNDQGTVFVGKINMNTTTGCSNLRQNRTVAVCTPSGPSGNIVHVSAVVNDTNKVNAIQVYVDGNFKFQENVGNQIDSYIMVPSGSHVLTVKAWDSSGSFSQYRAANVSGTSSASCTVGEILPYVQVCTPLANSTSSNPVHVHAIGATQNNPVTAMRLYVDNISTFTTNSSTLDTSVTLSTGVHKLTVQAWDWKGQTWKQTVYTTVQ